jgi:membrane protein DedA with SNARE-associated domain
MSPMLEAFLAWFLAYKYLVLFPFVFVEGPIVSIIAGSLAANGELNFMVAYVIIIAADEAADSMYYAFGRYGRDRFLKRWGKYIGLGEDKMKKVDKHFLNHAARTLILGKLAFSFEIPFMVAAGLARYPFWRFLLYMVIAAAPKSLGLMLIGYFFGFSIAKAKHDLFVAGLFAFAGLVMIGLIYLVRHVINNRAHILSWIGLANGRPKTKRRSSLKRLASRHS